MPNRAAARFGGCEPKAERFEEKETDMKTTTCGYGGVDVVAIEVIEEVG